MHRHAGTWLVVCAVWIGVVAPAAAGEVVSDLIVRDRHSRPVGDLRPEEIEIVDGGVAVKVASLRQGGGPGHAPLVSLVFDQAGAAASLVRPALLELIASLSAKGAFVSVWRISDRLEAIQPFSRDEAALKRAIEEATNPSGKGPLRVEGTGALESPEAASGLALETRLALEAQFTIERQHRIERDEPSRTSVAVLLALARQQRAFQGRKTVVYICDPRQMAGLEAERVQSVVGAANAAGLSFYTVDAARLAGSDALPKTKARSSNPRAKSCLSQCSPRRPSFPRSVNWPSPPGGCTSPARRTCRRSSASWART